MIEKIEKEEIPTDNRGRQKTEHPSKVRGGEGARQPCREAKEARCMLFKGRVKVFA